MDATDARHAMTAEKTDANPINTASNAAERSGCRAKPRTRDGRGGGLKESSGNAAETTNPSISDGTPESCRAMKAACNPLGKGVCLAVGLYNVAWSGTRKATINEDSPWLQ